MKKERLQSVETSYQEALDYLYSFIDLESKTVDRYHASKMNTERPKHLLGLLGDPHLKYQTIHIAGTKGKGSVAAMCAAVLAAAGLRVGLYTSPHLQDFRERIRIVSSADPEGLIGKKEFVDRLSEVKPLLKDVPGVTWFEIVTAVAFSQFALVEVDAAVIEVGLGGRLDATNAVEPLVSVITSLSIDHTNLLGNSIAEIAYEKGGIIKPGVPVISASQPDEAMAVLMDISRSRENPISIVGQNWQYTGQSKELIVTESGDTELIPASSTFKLALAGEHQLENAVVVLATLAEIKTQFPMIKLGAIRQGLINANWHGRLQTVYDSDVHPMFLVDVAHNKDSASKLAVALIQEYSYKRLWLIFGAPTDKAIDEMMRLLFPLADGIIVSSADHPRAATAEKLATQAQNLGFETIEIEDVDNALLKAFQLAGPEDLICATGSIIFVGDLLNQWDGLKSKLDDN